MAKKKSKIKNLIILVVFLAIAGALVVFGTKSGKKGIEVTIGKVERGDITSLVTATGKVQPEVEVKISSEVPGEIIELAIKDGDFVEKGEMLVKVNPDTLDAQVKQQEAALAATRASSAQRRAEMLQSELDLSRTSDLFAKGFVTEDELDQAKTRVDVTKAALEAAQHQIERQDMQLREASDKLAKATIYSPMTGTVTRLNSEIGDRVVGTGQFAGTEILRVADLNNMEVRVQVSEADIVNVKVGQVAKIEVDAFTKTEFTGIVTEIANSALTSNERSQEQLTTFEVRIRLDESEQVLRPGMTATADIETGTVTDVLKVPIGSVIVRPKRELEQDNDESGEDAEKQEKAASESEEDDEEETRVRVVFLYKEDKAELVQVETGIADMDDIEIISGLEEDDEIITGSYRALTRELKDGSDVYLREEDDKDKNKDKE